MKSLLRVVACLSLILSFNSNGLEVNIAGQATGTVEVVLHPTGGGSGYNPYPEIPFTVYGNPTMDTDVQLTLNAQTQSYTMTLAGSPISWSGIQEETRTVIPAGSFTAQEILFRDEVQIDISGFQYTTTGGYSCDGALCGLDRVMNGFNAEYLVSHKMYEDNILVDEYIYSDNFSNRPNWVSPWWGMGTSEDERDVYNAQCGFYCVDFSDFGDDGSLLFFSDQSYNPAASWTPIQINSSHGAYLNIGRLPISGSEVPLPAGIYLFLSGLVGLGLIKKRK